MKRGKEEKGKGKENIILEMNDKRKRRKRRKKK